MISMSSTAPLGAGGGPPGMLRRAERRASHQPALVGQFGFVSLAQSDLGLCVSNHRRPDPDGRVRGDMSSAVARLEAEVARLQPMRVALDELQAAKVQLQAAERRAAMPAGQTQLGGAKPLGLRINPPDHERSEGMAGSQDDKTVMLLTLELVCQGQDPKIDKKDLTEGRVTQSDEFKHGMPNPIAKEREQFSRATVPPVCRF